MSFNHLINIICSLLTPQEIIKLITGKYFVGFSANRSSRSNSFRVSIISFSPRNACRLSGEIRSLPATVILHELFSSFRVCMCGEYACMRACACAKHSSIEYGRHRYACAPARRELRRSSASAVSDPKTKMGTPFTLRRASRNRWSSSAERATSKMAKQKSLCTT